MPLNLTATDRKLLLATGMALALLVGIALLFGDASSRPGLSSTYSSGPDGCKAVYLVLRQLGYSVTRWERSPLELKDAGGSTLMLVNPSAFPNSEERAALRRFIADGGRLIATGSFSAYLLPHEQLISSALRPDLWHRYPALEPSAASRTAPAITMNAESRWSKNSQVVALYGDALGAVAVRYRYGKGEVFWLAGPTPMTNAGLREPGNFEFLLSMLDEKPNSRILFDEYFHGYRQSLAASVAHSQIKWLFAQLALLAAAVLFTFSRRSGPVRPRPLESRLSPLEFVTTLAGLYRRVHASAVAVDVAYQRFRFWALRRLALPPSASVELLEQTLAERYNFRDPALGAVLRECESARFFHDLNPKDALRLVRALHRFSRELKLFPLTQEP